MESNVGHFKNFLLISLQIEMCDYSFDLKMKNRRLHHYKRHIWFDGNNVAG